MRCKWNLVIAILHPLTNCSSRDSPTASAGMSDHHGSSSSLPSSDYPQNFRETPRHRLLILDPHNVNISQLDSDTVERRNSVAHSSPESLPCLILESIRARTNQEGTYHDGRDIVCFNRSIISFHLIYRVFCGDISVYHLLSEKNPKCTNPVSCTIVWGKSQLINQSFLT